MIYVSPESDIMIHRGNSAMLTASLTDVIDKTTRQPYEMKEGDILTLTVRKRPRKDSDIVLQAVSGDKYIHLTKEATDIDVGMYSYDLSLDTATGEHITVIPNIKEQESCSCSFKNFEVCAEVF